MYSPENFELNINKSELVKDLTTYYNDSDEEEGKGNDFDNIGYENYESGEGMTEFTDYFTSETDPENIQLSERGQEVLRRINFNFKPSNCKNF